VLSTHLDRDGAPADLLRGGEGVVARLS
jgi:hypothetical protein